MALFFFYGWLIFPYIYVPLISVLTSRNIVNLSFKRKTVWNKKLFHNIILLLIPLRFYSYALDSSYSLTICSSFSNKYTRSFYFWIMSIINRGLYFSVPKNIKSEKYGGEEGRKFKSGKERRERDKQAINLLNRSWKFNKMPYCLLGKMYENITLKIFSKNLRFLIKSGTL